MRAATKLTSKGQVVIPRAVRERLRWTKGTRLNVEVGAGGKVLLWPVEADDVVERLCGCLRGGPGNALRDLEREHAAEVAADARFRRRR